MGFEQELFQVSDAELASQALNPVGGPNGFPAASAFDSITLERLQANGPVRLNLPTEYAPFAEGKFGTPSGKCELYSPREAAAGRDPLPCYIPPHEDPQTQPDLAAKYPLQMVCPPEPSFLNSSFVNVDVLRKSAGEPTVQIHPIDAETRRITDGELVTIFNDRGKFRARAVIGETVKPGVVVSFSVWWNKYAGGPNTNATTATALTDFGAGATFFDNLVEIRGHKSEVRGQSPVGRSESSDI
jgi:anaerobic selenocysteine-containing dehydrogenase